MKKILNSLKNSRRNNSTLIINATESINDRKIDLDECSRKIYMLNNDVNRIRKNKNNLISTLK